MGSLKVYDFIKNSFLKPLILDEDVTDISYNGKDIYYQNNIFGRKKYDLEISLNDVYDFLRQIANLCEQYFSIAHPILDISIRNIRLNATYFSIARVDYEKSLSFSIRIARDNLNIDSKTFMSDICRQFLIDLVQSKSSIIICGQTSSGKTQLQKYLIRHLLPNTRAIIIDNVLELNDLTQCNELDITCWQYDDLKDNMTLKALIKNALRNNPDYLVLAESRGEEMFDIINASLSGCPIITTIHSHDIKSIIDRMVSLSLLCDKKITAEYVKNNIYQNIHYFVFVNVITTKNEMIERFVEKIAYLSNDGSLQIIYEKNKKENDLTRHRKMLGELRWKK